MRFQSKPNTGADMVSMLMQALHLETRLKSGRLQLCCKAESSPFASLRQSRESAMLSLRRVASEPCRLWLSSP